MQTPESPGEELQSPSVNHVGQTTKETKRAFRRETVGKRRQDGDRHVLCREIEKGLWREHGRPDLSEHFCLFQIENIFGRVKNNFPHQKRSFSASQFL